MSTQKARLRPAKATDVAAVEALTAAAYRDFERRIGYPPQPVTADYAALVAEGRVEVLIRDGGLVGVLVTFPEPDHLLLYSIAVAPGRRGRGYGRAMMSHAEAKARRLGRPRVVLYTNEKMPENVRFYEALGYERFDRRAHPSQAESWLIYMRKAV